MNFTIESQDHIIHIESPFIQSQNISKSTSSTYNPSDKSLGEFHRIAFHRYCAQQTCCQVPCRFSGGAMGSLPSFSEASDLWDIVLVGPRHASHQLPAAEVYTVLAKQNLNISNNMKTMQSATNITWGPLVFEDQHQCYQVSFLWECGKWEPTNIYQTTCPQRSSLLNLWPSQVGGMLPIQLHWFRNQHGMCYDDLRCATLIFRIQGNLSLANLAQLPGRL